VVGFMWFSLDTSSPVLFGMACIGLSPTTVTAGFEDNLNAGFQPQI